MKKKEMISLTKEEKKMYPSRKNAIYAKKQFSADNNNKKYHKVIDHCHYTGKYRRAAHDISNLSYKIPK